MTSGTEATVVVLAGNLDVYTVPELWQRLPLDEMPLQRVVIDLSGVDLLDSTGLGAVVSLRNRVVRDGGRCGVAVGRMRRLFDIAGLSSALGCRADVEGVLADLRHGNPPASRGRAAPGRTRAPSDPADPPLRPRRPGAWAGGQTPRRSFPGHAAGMLPGTR